MVVFSKRVRKVTFNVKRIYRKWVNKLLLYLQGSTGAISSPSWVANFFIMIAPGRTLLETDTVTYFFTKSPEKVLLIIRRQRENSVSPTGCFNTALSIRLGGQLRMRAARSYPHAFCNRSRHLETEERHLTIDYSRACQFPVSMTY